MVPPLSFQILPVFLYLQLKKKIPEFEWERRANSRKEKGVMSIGESQGICSGNSSSPEMPSAIGFSLV